MIETIGQVINRVKIEDAFHDIPEYALLQYAIDSYKPLVRSGDYAIKKTAILDVDTATQSAQFPSDYLSYIKLAVCVNGEIAILDYDPTICNAPEKVCNCGNAHPEAQPDTDWYWWCTYCGGWYGTGFLNFAGDYLTSYTDPRYGRLFGYMDLRNKYGKFNILDGRIVLGGNFQYDYIIMEYISIATTLAIDTEIDSWVAIQLVPAIKIKAEMSRKRPDYNRINYLIQQESQIKKDNLIHKYNWDLNDLTKVWKRGFSLLKF